MATKPDHVQHLLDNFSKSASWRAPHLYACRSHCCYMLLQTPSGSTNELQQILIVCRLQDLHWYILYVLSRRACWMWSQQWAERQRSTKVRKFKFWSFFFGRSDDETHRERKMKRNVNSVKKEEGSKAKTSLHKREWGKIRWQRQKRIEKKNPNDIKTQHRLRLVHNK